MTTWRGLGYRTPMIRTLIMAAASLTLAACSASPAAPPVDESLAPLTNPPPTKLTGYLKSDALDGASLLGPPPAVDSARGKADRLAFEETRSLKDGPRWKQAVVDNDLWGGGALKGYACAAGVTLDEAQTPVTLRILHRIELDVRTVGTPAKDHYGRLRPMIGNDAPICVPREDWMKTNSSYPSGHSMAGWSWGLVLAELKPEKADALLAVGKRVGDSRVICGVHFPSDVEAGRTLGSAMMARLHADAQFQADMAKARQELARSKPPTGCGA